MWFFKTYVGPGGKHEVQQDVDRQSDAWLEHFRARIKYLARVPVADWHTPHAKKLQGVKDLYEIRFKANGVQHRPLGFFGPGPSEFTILILATHKDDVYKPSSAIDTAAQRRKAIQSGQASTAPLQVDGEGFPPIE